jgi:hypothetical protein
MKIKLVWLGCILAALFSARATHASTTMTLEQVGTNVVLTGSGRLNTNALTLVGYTGEDSSIQGQISPASALLLTGNGSLFFYTSISGPTSFGRGGVSVSSSSSGYIFGIEGDSAQLFVPGGYISSFPIQGTATWNNTTLPALGVTPGIYTWTWGSGADADSLTLYAGVPALGSTTPEPAPALLLTLGAAALALFARLRARLCDTLEISSR